MKAFVERLKQRQLVQWAIAYVAFWFALLQGIDIVASRFNWPDSIERYFILALAIGFCVTLVLVWYHGERGAQRVGSMEIMILALLLAIGGVLIWHFGPAAIQPRHALAAQSGASAASAPAVVKPAAAAPAHTAKFNPPSDTIVVLPFANLGGDKSQQYFSDGITEELTNALGQNTGLRVIAWDTASKYRDGKQSATDIGKQLDVANVLSGKILRQGDEVRVIVELVNTANGYQVWSHHYDDSLKNIFAVQDRITQSIASALKVKFAAARAAQTVNPQAHDLVLKGVAAMNSRAAAGYEQARKDFEQAITIDPNYAAAHAWLARAIYDLTQFTTLSLKEALPKVRAEAHKALALDPNNVSAIIALANADFGQGNTAKAKAGYERAIKFDPSNAAAHLNYALTLPPRQALVEALRAVQLDPQDTTAQNNLAVDYLNLGEYQQALPTSQALMRLAPQSPDTAFGLALNYALLHRNEDAVKAFDLAQPATELGKQLVAAGKLAYQSVLDPKLHAQALAAANALHQRPDLDPDSLSNLMQVYLVLGDKNTALDLLDKSCAPTPFACNDLAINPTYIPLRSDPRFEALAKKYATAASVPASVAATPP